MVLFKEKEELLVFYLSYLIRESSRKNSSEKKSWTYIIVSIALLYILWTDLKKSFKEIVSFSTNILSMSEMKNFC